MLQVKSAFQFQPRADKNAYRSLGVIYIHPSRVNDSNRGISFDRPGGFYAQTWVGNVQLAAGDWVVTSWSNNRYVVKHGDWAVNHFRPSLWERIKRIIR